jgi:FMN phosphatase YigB (HAD superfamily)
MPLDLARIRALCFDVDGTIADTDDHLVAQLAACSAGAGRQRPARRARWRARW